jgi:anaerobic selenocysteine-containing dehydrogenase
MRNELNSRKERRTSHPLKQQPGKRGRRAQIDGWQYTRIAWEEIIGEMHAKLMKIPAYATSWRAKPKDTTKAGGRP